MSRAAIISVSTSILLALAISAFILLAPSGLFVWLESIPAKLLTLVLSLVLVAHLGWQMYFLFYTPTSQRLIYSLIRLIVPSCLATAAFPGISHLIASLNFNYTEYGSQLSDNSLVLNRDLNVAIKPPVFDGWQALTTGAGLMFAIIAAVVLAMLFIQVERDARNRTVTLA